MWMMGYSDGGEFNMPNPFNGRKLRQLMPRPATITSTSNSSTTNPPCISATAAEQSKREANSQQVVVSSRWNPTPEQLQTLEELYQQGTRTPSADQIQRITAHLRRYGKIEGKNVFYWFQNHKARERQKRRRQLESGSHEQFRDSESIERNESAANRAAFEVEQTKNWSLPSNCSTLAEKTASTQRAAPEGRAAGWVRFREGELQQRRSIERNVTWQMMELSCSPPTHFINSSNITATTPQTARTMGKKLINAQDLNNFIAPYREDFNHLDSVGDGPTDEEGCGRGGSQTLQLFPLRSGDGDGNFAEKETEILIAAMNSNSTSHQFFEFLPLKN